MAGILFRDVDSIAVFAIWQTQMLYFIFQIKNDFRTH